MPGKGGDDFRSPTPQSPPVGRGRSIDCPITYSPSQRERARGWAIQFRPPSVPTPISDGHRYLGGHGFRLARPIGRLVRELCAHRVNWFKLVVYWGEINHGWRSIDAHVALTGGSSVDCASLWIGRFAAQGRRGHRPGQRLSVSRDLADRQSSGDTGELGVWLRTVGRLSRRLGLQRQYHDVGRGDRDPVGLRGEFAATGIAWDLGAVYYHYPGTLEPEKDYVEPRLGLSHEFAAAAMPRAALFADYLSSPQAPHDPQWRYDLSRRITSLSGCSKTHRAGFNLKWNAASLASPIGVDQADSRS